MSDDKISLDDEAWREKLDPMAYAVLREEATERAFTGELWDEKRIGRYDCGGCGAPLFDSETKYESGTGWPSFFRPREDAPIGERVDRRLFLKRTEVHCDRCGGNSRVSRTCRQRFLGVQNLQNLVLGCPEVGGCPEVFQKFLQTTEIICMCLGVYQMQ